MKRKWLAWCAALIILAAPQAVAAQGKPVDSPGDFRVAVINYPILTRKALIFKDAAKQVGAYRIAFQEAVKAADGEVRRVNEELGRKRAILAPDAYAAERRKYEEQVAQLNANVKERERALREIEQRAEETVNNAVKQVVDEFANEFNVALIMRSEMTAFYASSLDITNLIVERLDKVAPTAKLPEASSATGSR